MRSFRSPNSRRCELRQARIKRRTDAGRRGAQESFACSTSGRRSRSCDGMPTGRSTEVSTSLSGRPRGIGSGLLPEEKLSLVLRLGDQLLVIGDGCRGVADIALELAQIELRDRAPVELRLGEPVRLLAGVECVPGDLEVEVQLAELRDRRWRRSPTRVSTTNAAAVLLREEIGIGLRCACCAAGPRSRAPRRHCPAPGDNSARGQ